MDKNVYSLVLLDDVVDAVDKLACERCTSRSGLVNQILAEYFSCSTPDTRIRDIFTCMEKTFDSLNGFRFSGQPGNSSVTIRSPLRYAYHPTVRYVLELYHNSSPYIGRLRVAFRTQNSSLLQLSEDFFRYWELLECRCIGSLFEGGKIPCTVEAGRYNRELRPPERRNCTDEEIAEAIRRYICRFDTALKQYFADPGNSEPVFPDPADDDMIL